MSRTVGLALAAGVSFGLNAAMAQQTANQDEIAAVVAEMLADAESRSSLLAGNAAGHDEGGFFIQSDGFSLRAGGQIQFRYNVNVRDEDDPDDFDTGFSLRRTRLTFDGTVADDFRYHIQANFGNDVSSGGTGTLEDAEIHYDWGNGWSMGMGQYKSWFSRDFGVDGRHTLAVERTVLDSVFGTGRQQGIFLHGQDEDWRTRLSFNDGIGSANSDFNTGGEADWAFTGRFEYKFSGTWDQFKDYTSPQGSDEGLLIGAGVHFEQRELTKGSSTGAIGDTDVTTVLYTFDGSYEGDGWNAAAGFYGAYNEFRSGGSDTDFNDFGVFVQGGVYVAENTELFGRWEGLFLDDDDARGSDLKDNHHWLTFGVNQYYAGHAAKASADVVVALEESMPTLTGIGALPNTNVGVLGSGETGEVAIRLQFQLLF